jgi:hypothetical protein
MTGSSDFSPSAVDHDEDGFDRLAMAAGPDLSRRQVAKLAGGLALAAMFPGLRATASASARSAPGPGSAAEAASGSVRASARRPWRRPAKTTGSCPPQPAGSCSNGSSPGPWSPSCQSTVANGTTSTYNGCGPEGGITSRHINPVPDNPLDLGSFFGPCVGHDCCYGTCGQSKATCDSNFFSDMLAACKSDWPTNSVLDTAGYFYCAEVARIYYNYVATKGQSAFDAAQAEVCSCCTCGGVECTPAQTCCGGVCRDPCPPGQTLNPISCVCVKPPGIYCNCNKTCYTDATTCVSNCHVSLGCFTGICYQSATLCP